MKIDIKIVNKSNNPLPSYATAGSAGMDLRANLEENKTISIPPNQSYCVPTGIFLELPEGYEAQIRPRSGLAFKSGITVLNSPGTIDSDYRGEIKIILYNTSKENFDIKNGDRIAQMVIGQHSVVTWQVQKNEEELTSTCRGEGGYGSTGIK